MGKSLRIASIGCGFMGRTHALAYQTANRLFAPAVTPVLQVVCARDRDKGTGFARTWGYADSDTDWRRVVERKDVDAVDICVPNNLHNDIALAAAACGKAVLCEKPLAMNLDEAETMVDAIERAGVANTVWFNYRRIPAVTLAKQLVEEGKLGRIFHYRASFLQDWTIAADLPQGGEALWRLDARAAGSGVTGDLLAHCIDTALWVNGPIGEVKAMTATFVKERLHRGTGKLEPVDIDDACVFTCRFDNGALGVFEATRYARGHKAGYSFEINGELGSLRWDLETLHVLEYCNHGDGGRLRGWRHIHVTNNGGEHPYMANWWVPGLQPGFESSFVHQVADFLVAYDRGDPCPPSFRDALATQEVCERVLGAARG